MANNKDIRQLLRRARKAGAVVDTTTDEHVRVRCPNGKTVYVATSASCYRALRNIRRDLRKIGNLDV
jgi:hypothetical protein